MNFPVTLTSILVVWLTTSCGPSMDAQLQDYKATVRSGIKKLPWPTEMEALFGEGDHFITHYNFSPGPKTWNTEVFFGGRYELTLQLDIQIDYKNLTVVKAVTAPTFYLAEVERVQASSSGQPIAFYSDDWSFDETKWKELYRNGGDWSKIGISVKSNAVPGFDQYVKAMREPRVRVPH